MKISNVNSNIAEFFRKNGKKWACTAVTALMLSTPAIAKTEKKKDDVKPSTTIEQNVDSKEHMVLNLSDFKENLEIMSDNLRDSLQNNLKDFRLLLKDHYFFYGEWQEQDGIYVREITELAVNEEKLNNLIQQFLKDSDIESLTEESINEITEIVGKKVEISKTLPNDYGKTHVQQGDVKIDYNNDEQTVEIDNNMIFKYYGKWNPTEDGKFKRTIYRLKPKGEFYFDFLGMHSRFADKDYDLMLMHFRNDSYDIEKYYTIVESYEEISDDNEKDNKIYLQVEGTDIVVEETADMSTDDVIICNVLFWGIVVGVPLFIIEFIKMKSFHY